MTNSGASRRLSQRHSRDRTKSFAEAKLAARQWAETLHESARQSQVALFTWTCMQGYAARAVPRARLRATTVFPGALHPTVAAIADNVGIEAVELGQLEALHAITSLYPALSSAKYRGALGAYYTPPALADRLVMLADEAGLDWRSARVLDPAAGGGALLLRCALKMRDAMRDVEPAIALAQLGNRLLGLEVDPYAASVAQCSLEILLADLAAESGHPVPKIVHARDTLIEPPEAKFDLVIGNPPYGRVALTPAQRKEFARSLYGHANLYGVFTDIAIRWAKKGGLIAYLTPASMLGGQYFSALRSLIGKAAPPLNLAFVHARSGVFEDVLQETLLAVYVKGAAPLRVSVQHLRLQNENELEICRNGTIALPSDPSKPWLAPRDPHHSALIGRVERMPHRLGDWGYAVSTGPLVWNRHKPQLRNTAGRNCLPLVWAESITWDGRFEFSAAKKNHMPWFELRADDTWLVVREPCVLVQRTTAKEQARRLIAAELPEQLLKIHGGVVIENHLNMVWRKSSAKVSPAAVAAVLNSRAADEVFRCISGSVAVSAFELQALPLPSPAAMRPIERLIARNVPREQIKAAIDSLYGLES